MLQLAGALEVSSDDDDFGEDGREDLIGSGHVVAERCLDVEMKVDAPGRDLVAQSQVLELT